MDEIGNVLDRIHEHMAKADRIDPQYRQAFQELDKNIRAMKRAQNDNAATELAVDPDWQGAYHSGNTYGRAGTSFPVVPDCRG